MPKAHKHEGTFGGSRAADVLDRLLCGLNNEDLIRKIGRCISWATNIRNRVQHTVQDSGFKILLISIHRKMVVDRIDSLDRLQYGINETEMNLIKSYAKNVAWTILRQANKRKKKYMVPEIVVRCQTPDCSFFKKIVNRITDIETLEDRALMIEDWKEASEDADHCRKCGELGVPDEDEIEDGVEEEEEEDDEEDLGEDFETEDDEIDDDDD